MRLGGVTSYTDIGNMDTGGGGGQLGWGEWGGVLHRCWRHRGWVLHTSANRNHPDSKHSHLAGVGATKTSISIDIMGVGE